MKFSTKGRYGLKAMLDLAVHNNEGQVVLKSIAERQGLSENYLEQLFAVLKKAGLVKSVRGSQGGYTLAEDPAKITVGEILRALEGSLISNDCVVENGECCVSSYNCCVTKSVWMKIQEGIDNVTNGISLQQLADDFNKSKSLADSTFYI
jgi:Rrf2 family transcriptional regulator, cysteine metabolism repressor